MHYMSDFPSFFLDLASCAQTLESDEEMSFSSCTSSADRACFDVGVETKLKKEKREKHCSMRIVENREICTYCIL